jgi:hypothetical protein
MPFSNAALAGAILGSTALILQATAVYGADLTVSHIEAKLVRQLEVNPLESFAGSGLVSTMSAKDASAYLILRPTILASHAEAQKSTTPSLRSGEITVTSPTGVKIKPIGTYTLDGVFSGFLSSTLHLLALDQGTEKQFHISLVYPANPGWKDCVLNLGGSNYPVQFPAVVDHIPRVVPARFEILKSEIETNEVESGSVLARSPELQVRVKPLTGRFLALQLKAQPEKPNVSQEGIDHIESFSLSSADLGILIDGTDYHPCAGGEMNGKIYMGTTKQSYLKEGGWQPLQGRYFFVLPPSGEKFLLLYKGLEIARGVLSK